MEGPEADAEKDEADDDAEKDAEYASGEITKETDESGRGVEQYDGSSKPSMVSEDTVAPST